MAASRFGVLLVTVWYEQGMPVARLRGFGGNGEPRELGPAAGRTKILAIMDRWLAEVEFPTAEARTGGDVT